MMIRRILAIGLLAGALLPAGVHADDALKAALANVPTDAMGFICLPHVKHTDADIKQVLHDLGLEESAGLPEGSLLALLRQQAPFLEHLDDDGALAIVMMPADTLPELSQKMAIVVTAKDPQALLDALSGQAGEDGTYTVTVFGQQSYAVVLDKQVVLSQMPDVAKTIKDGERGIAGKIKAPVMEALEGADLALWLDGARFFKLVKPMLEPFMMMAMSQGAAGNAFQAKSMEINKKNMDMFFDGAGAVCMGVKLDKPGATMRFGMEAKPGTDLAKNMNVKATDGPLLQGLPAGDYVVVFGQAVDKAQMDVAVKNLEPFFSMADGVEGIDQEKVGELKGQFEKLLTGMTALRGVLEPITPGPKGLIGVSLLIDTADSKAWIETAAKAVDLAQRTFAGSESAVPDEDVKNVLTAITYEAAAAKVGEVPVDHLKLDLAKAGDLDEEEVDEALGVIGEEGLLLRLAPANPKTVAITFGGGEEYLSRLLAQAGKDESPLQKDTGIVKVSAHLPKSRNVVMYGSLDHGLATAQNVLKALDEDPLPFPVPQTDAPLAMTQTGGEGWTRVDVFCPLEMMQAIKSIVSAMMAAQQPGEEVATTHGVDSAEQ